MSSPGKQLGERFRIDDGAGEAVVADLAALLDHHHGELDVGGLGELLQPDRAAERGRAGPDEQDVDFEGIAQWHDPPEFAHRPSGSPR